MEIGVDLDQGLCIDRDITDREGDPAPRGAVFADATLADEADFSDADLDFSAEAAFPQDRIIDVDIEEIDPPEHQRTAATPPRIAERFNTETRFHGLSLSQLAVHSLWIVDYLRQLGVTEMADGDLDSISRCADDLESAIMLMFQLAGGTRQELHQRYEDIKLAMQASQRMTIDLGRTQ